MSELNQDGFVGGQVLTFAQLAQLRKKVKGDDSTQSDSQKKRRAKHQDKPTSEAGISEAAAAE